MFNDTLHADGSKTYETLNYGYITIENPSLVKEIENILAGNHQGWSYLPILQKFVDDGLDTRNEISKAIKILD